MKTILVGVTLFLSLVANYTLGKEVDCNSKKEMFDFSFQAEGVKFDYTVFFSGCNNKSQIYTFVPNHKNKSGSSEFEVSIPKRVSKGERVWEIGEAVSINFSNNTLEFYVHSYAQSSERFVPRLHNPDSMIIVNLELGNSTPRVVSIISRI